MQTEVAHFTGKIQQINSGLNAKFIVPDWDVRPLLNRRGSHRLVPGEASASSSDFFVEFRITVPTEVSDEVVLAVVSE